MTEQRASRQGIKRQIPRHLGFVLFIYDVAALLGAFLFTKYAAHFIILITD